MNCRFLLSGVLAGCALLVGACNYDSSLTAKPTHAVDSRLIGDWVAVDKDNAKGDTIHVRKLDDTDYVVGMDDDIYRAFHSDFAGKPFVSVQNLQPGSDDRQYVYFLWELSADGSHLTITGVSTKVVPEETKGRAAITKLIKANLANPELFAEPVVFVRQ